MIQGGVWNAESQRTQSSVSSNSSALSATLRFKFLFADLRFVFNGNCSGTCK